jgi:hypothetical protein
MIRCKCGKFTNYGLTCTSCRTTYSFLQKDYDSLEEEEEEEPEKEADSEEESIDDYPEEF